MKKIYTLIAGILMTVSVFAQAPEKMSYQAVIRDASNNLVTNQTVGMRISILQGSIFGASVYVETQTPNTNNNGLVSIEIGSGTVIFGAFDTIDWTIGPYFIKTETDLTGGTSYTITSTSQFMSVPYALYAKTSGSSTPGPQGPAGADGNGIASTRDNGDGTITFIYDDGSTFTTSDLTGPQGNTGVTGEGVPTGGTAGQALVKIDSTDYNTEWSNINTGRIYVARAEFDGAGNISALFFSDFSGTGAHSTAGASASFVYRTGSFIFSNEVAPPKSILVYAADVRDNTYSITHINGGGDTISGHKLSGFTFQPYTSPSGEPNQVDADLFTAFGSGMILELDLQRSNFDWDSSTTLPPGAAHAYIVFSF